MDLIKSSTQLIVFSTYFSSSSELAAYLIQALAVSNYLIRYSDCKVFYFYLQSPTLWATLQVLLIFAMLIIEVFIYFWYANEVQVEVCLY